MIKLILGIFFLPLMVMDYKEKRINWPYLVILLIVFGSVELVRGSYAIPSRIASFLLGVLFTGSCLLFHKSIGMGDGLSVLLISFVTELSELILLLLISFSLTGLLGLVCFVIFRRNRLVVPFLQFLFVGFAAVILLGSLPPL